MPKERIYTEPTDEKERYTPPAPVESIKINGREIRLGQSNVPILAHGRCPGSMGTVTEIRGNDIKARCNTCHTPNLMVDLANL